MFNQTIGENAGTIYTDLQENGQSKVSGLKNRTGLNDKDLYMSLGWLAREEKLDFEKIGKQILIKLAD